MEEGRYMFAVMIGNEPGDIFRIKKTVNLLRDIVTIASVDQGRMSGLCCSVDDVQELLSWYEGVDDIMSNLQYADTEV
jgi:hypothetical protein